MSICSASLYSFHAIQAACKPASKSFSQLSNHSAWFLNCTTTLLRITESGSTEEVGAGISPPPPPPPFVTGIKQQSCLRLRQKQSERIKIQHFPGGACPHTPLVGTHTYTCVSVFSCTTIILAPPPPPPNSNSCMKPWFTNWSSLQSIQHLKC